MFVTVQDPVRGELTMPAWPVRMADSAIPVTTALLLGEYNAEVYGEWLGFTPEQVARLRQKVI